LDSWGIPVRKRRQIWFLNQENYRPEGRERNENAAIDINNEADDVA
jgi:hypothetical protein